MQADDARPNLMDIDLGALDANTALIRRLARPGTAIIASVKANAYGHGIVPVAKRLAAANVEVLATGSIADAKALRQAGIAAPILMMGGALPTAIPRLVADDLIPTIHGPELADAVASAAIGAGRRISVYVKVDCGFGRLGVALRDARQFVLDLARKPNVHIAGLYTHLPFADAAGLAFARERIARFEGLVRVLESDGLQIPITQARASAALLAGIEDCCSAVSPGALIYGLAPVDDGLIALPELRPVLSRITTRLIQISPWAADQTPAFAGRYARRVAGSTGVVPFGRVDGNRMPVPDRGAHMLVRGRAAPILGVSLEHAVLDLSGIPDAKVGDEVLVLGHAGDRRIDLGDIARWQSVGDNDVLMNLDRRVPLRHVGSR